MICCLRDRNPFFEVKKNFQVYSRLPSCKALIETLGKTVQDDRRFDQGSDPGPIPGKRLFQIYNIFRLLCLLENLFHRLGRLPVTIRGKVAVSFCHGQGSVAQ